MKQQVQQNAVSAALEEALRVSIASHEVDPQSVHVVHLCAPKDAE